MVKQIGPDDLDAIGVVSIDHRAYLLDAVRLLREQGAAWVYLILGAKERAEQEYYDSGDRVSASSGIASASSMPWGVEEQELSGSSCECDQQNNRPQQQFRPRSRRGSSKKRVQQHKNGQRTSPVSSSSRSPSVVASVEQHSCLTETTDCPSEVSFLTSISRRSGRGTLTPMASSVSTAATPTNVKGVVNSGVSLSCEELDRIQIAPPIPPPPIPPNGSQPIGNMNCLFTPLQLRMLVRDKLIREGIRLSSAPYTSKVRFYKINPFSLNMT